MTRARVAWWRVLGKRRMMWRSEFFFLALADAVKVE